MAKVSTSIYHDTRRGKSNNLYPLKLRVYYKEETRLYPFERFLKTYPDLVTEMTEEDYNNSYLAPKPRGELKKLSINISKILTDATKITDELKDFDFDKFENKIFRETHSSNDVFYFYNLKIQELKKEERVNTASNYNCSLNSLKEYWKTKSKTAKELQFNKINIAFLNDYEKWMNTNGKESTTVGIYLRPLRAILNQAINDKLIDRDNYPFGKYKYEIPTGGNNIDKAFTKDDLAILYNYDLPEGSLMSKARDFWFFSYECNGMNMTDIFRLKFKNISNDTFTFKRQKTKRTTKKKPIDIKVIISTNINNTILKYGNTSQPNNYLFPVIDDKLSEDEKIKKIQNFTRFVNQQMKKLAKIVGIDEKISTYFARHSYVTVTIREGGDLPLVQNNVGHTSPKTTMVYFSGHSEDKLRKNAKNIMNFVKQE